MKIKKIIINGVDTTYTINTIGEIFNKNNYKIKDRITQHGYKSVSLSYNNKRHNHYVHRLMAITFLDFKEDKNKVINHKDGNKTNNNLENLEIVTSSENLLHAYKTNLKQSNLGKSCNLFTGNLENEYWKQISGYDGDYEISNLGRVKSLKYKKPIILRQDIRCGYYSVVLSKQGITKHYQVHDLVFFTFSNIKEKEKGMVIDHIDGNKLNNNFNNLRYISISDNLNAAHYEQKLTSNCRSVDVYKDGIKLYTFPSISMASKKLQVDNSTISKICRRKAKTAHGYTFKYSEESSTVIS